MGGLSGSLFGTSSWSQTASVALSSPPQASASYALVAGTALNANSAAFASTANNAQNSVSTSFASVANLALTSSATVATFATSSTFAQTASFLLFIPGGSNGTASFSQRALTASFALSAVASTSVTSAYAATSSVADQANNSKTSSFVNWNGVSNNGTVFNSVSTSYSPVSDNSTSASHALVADVAYTSISSQTSASWASSSISTSYSAYADLARTASYTLPNTTNINYGIYSAITQSATSSQVDVVSVNTPLSVVMSVDVNGNITIPWTASMLLNESIALNVINRTTGVVTLLDTYPVYINMGNNVATFSGGITGSLTGSLSGSITGSITGSLTGSVTGSVVGSVTASMMAVMNGTITNNISGTMVVPFNLMGSTPVLTDDYMLYVKASSQNFSIFQNRNVKFAVDINYGTFAVSAGKPLAFYTDFPDPITFSSSLGGPFTDFAYNIVASGSNNIYMMDLTNVNQKAHYAWTLHSCSFVKATNAGALQDIGGMPFSLVTMSIQTASLSQLQDLSNTSLALMTCTNTPITQLPNLPNVMSYINVNTNHLTNISTLPGGLTQFYCDNSYISSLASLNMPNTIVSMSLSNNTNLNTLPVALPSALVYFWCRNNIQLTAFPPVPSQVIYLDVSNDSLTAAEEDGICADLQGNGLFNGYLDLRGNSSITSPTTLTRISTLNSRGWTVLYT